MLLSSGSVQVMCEWLKLSVGKVQLGVLQSMDAFFQGLMLLEDEHADLEALAEILLETCKSVTCSLGECGALTVVRTPNFKPQAVKLPIFPPLCWELDLRDSCRTTSST